MWWREAQWGWLRPSWTMWTILYMTPLRTKGVAVHIASSLFAAGRKDLGGLLSLPPSDFLILPFDFLKLLLIVVLLMSCWWSTEFPPWGINKVYLSYLTACMWSFSGSLHTDGTCRDESQHAQMVSANQQRATAHGATCLSDRQPAVSADHNDHYWCNSEEVRKYSTWIILI